MKLTKTFISDLQTSFGEEYNCVLKAIKFASKKHKGVLRDDGSPYITHPLAVAEYVRKFKQSKNASMLYMAAVLHDTIEDTYTSYRELCETFSDEVASIVMELSTAKVAPLWISGGNGGKAEYLAKKMGNMTNYALYIKLCDRLHNLTTLKGCDADKQTRTIADTRIILDYLKVVRKLTESQQRVANEIEKVLRELNKKGQ